MTESLININGDNVQTLEILLITTLISLAPSLVIMMTSFGRYIISLSFLRTALGTQQSPPNLVLSGIAIFLTIFTMSPVLTEINETAYQPYIIQIYGNAHKDLLGSLRTGTDLCLHTTP